MDLTDGDYIKPIPQNPQDETKIAHPEDNANSHGSPIATPTCFTVRLQHSQNLKSTKFKINGTQTPKAFMQLIYPSVLIVGARIIGLLIA
jgi:hypothetical protein